MEKKYYFQTVVRQAYEKHVQESNQVNALRSFARKVGINSGGLSLILRGIKSPGSKTASILIKYLNLSESDQLLFYRSLVDFKFRKLNTCNTERVLLRKISIQDYEKLKSLIGNIEKDFGPCDEDDDSNKKWVNVEILEFLEP